MMSRRGILGSILGAAAAGTTGALEALGRVPLPAVPLPSPSSLIVDGSICAEMITSNSITAELITLTPSPLSSIPGPIDASRIVGSPST